VAVDNFYNSPQPISTFGSGSSKPADIKKIEALFDSYKGDRHSLKLESYCACDQSADDYIQRGRQLVSTER
jgi:hypothetical protein